MPTTASNSAAGRTWRFPRLPLQGQLALLTMIWAVALATSVGVTIGIDWYGTVTGSVWEHIAGTTPWFVGFIGGYVMYTTVPLFVANGRTRRDSFTEWLIFAVAYAAGAAFLITTGYLFEWALYGVGSWPREVAWSHLFTSHTDVGRMWIEYLLTLLAWTIAGGFAGISVYRSPVKGWLSLVPASILVGVLGEIIRTPIGPFGAIVDRLPIQYASSLGSSLLIALACMTIFVTLAWMSARDFPIRTT